MLRQSTARSKLLFGGAAMYAVILASSPSLAADIRWQGAGVAGNTAAEPSSPTTQWSTPTNWQTAALPNDADHAILDFQNSGQVYAQSYHVEDLTLSGLAEGRLNLAGGAFDVDDLLTVGGNASILQTEGIQTIGRKLQVRGQAGSDAYVLQGGELRSGYAVPSWDALVEIGRGGFTQTGGVHDAAADVYIWSTLDDGGYRMLGGQLNVGSELWVYAPFGDVAGFRQSGGDVDVSHLRVASVNGTRGRYEFLGGTIRANAVELALGGHATFIQSAGDLIVAENISLAYFEHASAHMEVSGGTITATDFILAREGDSTVLQTGGAVSISDRLSFGRPGPIGLHAPESATYELVDGDLSAHHLQLGGLGAELLVQRAGSISANVLAITDNAVYRYHGGQLAVAANLTIQGTLDFSGQAAVLNLGANHIVDLSGSVLNAEQTSWSIGPDSLTILPANFDPLTKFASYSNLGHVMTAGSTFVLPAGKTIRGGGDVREFLDVHGRIEPSEGNLLDLHALRVRAGGVVNLGAREALIDRSGSGIDGGQLLARRTKLSANFTQTGGSVTLEEDLDLQSNYEISGGSLSVVDSTARGGTMRQTGGRVDVGDELKSFSGGYDLSGGTLTSKSTGLWNRSSIFQQTGGVHQTGVMRTISGAAYIISGGQLIADAVTVAADAGGSMTIYGTASVDVADRFSSHSGGVVKFHGGLLRTPTLEINPHPAVVFGWLGGRLEVDHVISNRLKNDGGVLAPTDVAADHAIGSLTLTGDYVQTAGRLEIELAGSERGVQYDVLQVTGAANLAGELRVSLLDNFEPVVGQTFDILDWGSLSGAFASIELPPLAPALRWDVSQLYANGSLAVLPALEADFDADGDVDGDDLADWTTSFATPASTTYIRSDADADRDVDGADFLIWQQQSGSRVAPTAVVATVPEPNAILLSLALYAGPLLFTRRFVSRP